MTNQWGPVNYNFETLRTPFSLFFFYSAVPFFDFIRLQKIRESQVAMDLVVHPSGDLLYLSNVLSVDEEQETLRHIYGNRSALHWTKLRSRRLINLGGLPSEHGMIAEDIPSWLQSDSAFYSRLQRCSDSVSTSNPVKREQEPLEKLAGEGDRIVGSCCWETLTRAIATSAWGSTPFIPAEMNHVLINEYTTTQGIMAHEDGPLYDPLVAIVSLGATVNLEFIQKRRDSHKLEDDEAAQHRISCILSPRSLVVFRGKFYSDYLHGIEEKQIQRVTSMFNHRMPLSLSVTTGECGELHVDNQGCLTLDRGVETRISITYRHVVKTRKLSKAVIFGK